MEIPPMEINCSIRNGKEIIWNVDLLRNDAQRKKKQIFQVDRIYNSEDNIDKQWAMKKESNEPIIITEENGKFEILDGKHRLYKAKIYGQKEIVAYLFEKCELDKYIYGMREYNDSLD